MVSRDVEPHTPDPSNTAIVPAGSSVLPPDWQERVFKAIAVQRPAVTAYIKEIRRNKPNATPAQVMRTIESQYVASTTIASGAIGASASIPVVGIPTAIGLGVADLLLFYETTALFALSMAELRGISIDDPERAKAVVLGALLGEKRKSRITELVLSALPAGATVRGARTVATKAVKISADSKWGDLLAHQLPDSALVPVTMVLARQAIAQGAVMGSVRISSKALPVIGAVAGGATSFYFGSSVVKACRAGFSEPMETWPATLDPDLDGDDAAPIQTRAMVAMRAASGSAKDFGEDVWKRMAAGASAVGSAGAGAAGAVGAVAKKIKAKGRHAQD